MTSEVSLVHAAQSSAAPAVSRADLAAAVQGVNRFALDLFQRLAGEGNLVMSPSSLASLLGMVLPGARGQTAAEIARVLHATLGPVPLARAIGMLEQELLASVDAGPVSVRVSNAVWLQHGWPVETAFLTLLAQAFRSGVRQVDFAHPERARQAINALVAEQTQGKISELLGPGALTELTRLVLTNAVYLNARWASPFPPDSTRPEPFHLLGGGTPEVQTMAQGPLTLPYAAGDGWQALELAYQGGALALDVLLPSAGSFGAFTRALDEQRVAAILGALRPVELTLALPRFAFDSDHSLGWVLASLDMPTAFGDAADFSGITTDEPFWVSAVVQKAHVAVDEEGTTAAAASALSMATARVFPFGVRVDRPFVFLIRDLASGLVLFLGQVTDPRLA
jgi:serpin B